MSLAQLLLAVLVTPLLHLASFELQLPLNISQLSTVNVSTYSYTSRSLTRHGATIGEFWVPPGVVVRPPTHRLLVIYTNIGNVSSIYQSNKSISSFHVVSPVVGLLPRSSKDGSSVEFLFTATGESMLVNFSTAVDGNGAALCAFFGLDGVPVEVFEAVERNVCATTRQGLFGLVISDSPGADVVHAGGDVEEMGRREGGGRRKKLLVGSMVAVGVLVIAVVLGLWRRRKRRVEERERRREFEEEAMQMPSVGHLWVAMDGSSPDTTIRPTSRERDRAGE